MGNEQPRPKVSTVKDYAHELMVAVHHIDEDGRPVGFSYREMQAIIRERFPVNLYPGPHRGKPVKLSIKHLREITYIRQSIDRSLRLPIRPRSDRKKKTKH